MMSGGNAATGVLVRSVFDFLGRSTATSVVGLAGAGVLAMAGCSTTPQPPETPDDACAILAEKPDWARAMRKAQRRWGVPVEVQLAIIRYESAFRHDARPRSATGGYASSAYGYSQAIDGTWDWYRTDTGRRSAKRTDFADAADFIGWYTSVSRRLLGLSSRDTYNHYLAYHEGHTGFRRGSYRKKPWLQSYARLVDKRARIYGAQLRHCRAGS